MKRSIKPRKVGIAPVLIGLVLVVGSVVALFSGGRSAWLSRLPVPAIGEQEWSWYHTWFDLRATGKSGASGPLLRFGTSREVKECVDAQQGGAWRTRWFEGEGYGDSVEVRNLLDREGFLVRFKKNALYQQQRRIQLIPANSSSRAGQLHALASELGLMAPAGRMVTVISCGSMLGTYRQEEWVDEEFLERRGVRGASLVRMGMDPSRPDQQFPVIDADSVERVKLRGTIERTLDEVGKGRTDMLAGLMDEKSVIAWLLMAWIDGRELDREPVTFFYQWSTGRMAPIYHAPTTRTDGTHRAPLLCNLLTPLLRRPAFRKRFEEEQVRLAARFPALWGRPTDSDPFLPSTAGEHEPDGPSPAHIADHRAATFLDRPTIPGPGHATFVHGLSLPAVAVGSLEDTALLAQVARRYKLIVQGDTMIFPRGKYEINEDLEFPAGRVVVLLPGARLFIAPGRNVVCKGDLYVRGTLRNPVFVRALDRSAPFGSIAVVGSGSQQCAISGLFLSGGAGAKLAGVDCGGMLSVQGAARTRIASSVFQENRGAASLLVDGGELQMREVRFEGAAREFVRMDHIRGVLKDITMVGERDGVTTGLHIGTGTVAVLGGVYTGLKGSAILVDGAAQVLVRNTRLSRNATAIRSEGRAEVHVEGNTIDGNEIVFHAGASAPGDRFMIYPNTLTGNTIDRSGGGLSSEKAALDPSTVSQFGVPMDGPKAEQAGSRRGRRSRGGDSAR